MDIVKISDASMTMHKKTGMGKLSFKNKLELARLLDRLGTSVIELESMENVKVDSLLIKSVAGNTKNSVVAVPVDFKEESVDNVWNALKGAKYPRLQVPAPVSTVQMEYLYHKKAPDMKALITDTIKNCCRYTADVEFIADDATRADEDFLYDVVGAAMDAGASTITVCDTAGTMLPVEFHSFLDKLYANIPSLKDVTLGVSCSNGLSVANACAVVAVSNGAREIKTTACTGDIASFADMARILSAKGGTLGISCLVRTVELGRVIKQINWLCNTEKSKTTPFENGVNDEEDTMLLSSSDNMQAVLAAVKKLGYDLSDEDGQLVWEAFERIAAKKDSISGRELDAIVASAAMQVPAAYTLEKYVINHGNTIGSTAHITMIKDGEKMESVVIGDGPVDAAFLAIEKIVGCHYELDDFQVRSVTEGQEAVGETVVRLISNGKIYPGRGISTDIIGSSIRAYVNALNKIVYEEAEA